MKLQTLAMGGILGAALLFSAPSASAADFSISVGVGTRPAPVIVEGGYYEHVWVEPVYRTEYYSGGSRRVIVTQGYYRPVYHSGVYVRPSSGIVIQGSIGSHHHHHHRDRHHHSLHDRNGFYRRDKPGRYR